MHMTHLQRSIAAVATALACLLALGNPAAAIPTTYTAAITGGEITMTKSGITPEVIDLDSTTSCTSASMNLNVTSDTSSSNATITAFNWSHVVTFPNGGNYLETLTRSTTGNTAGHLTSTTTPHTIGPIGTTPPRVALVFTIYNTTSCTPTGTPVCTLAFQLNLANFTTTSVSTSTTFSFTGTSQGTVAAFPTCTAGPSFLAGAAVNLSTPVTGHFTGTV
jgi:hypothetical protein